MDWVEFVCSALAQNLGVSVEQRHETLRVEKIRMHQIQEQSTNFTHPTMYEKTRANEDDK